jgi:non-canonical (house-cleaning) NTP pyrophosphatase
MKIIQQGRSQEGWSAEAVCTGKGNGDGGCGAKLLVEQPDLYRTSSSHYDGSTDYYVTFTCPSCSVESDLKGVPSNIASTLEKKGDARPGVAPKPAVRLRTSPISIGVAGKSKIKIAAVEAVRNRQGIHATVNGVDGSSSGVSEQPTGKPEIIRGAINRTLTSWDSDPRFDVYIGIENGIADIDGQTVDFAVCCFFVPSCGLFQLSETDKCPFPAEAVKAAQLRTFEDHTITVGKILVEMGLVKDHADPHIDLIGIHRQELIERAIELLFDLMPVGVFLREPHGQ